LLMAGGAGTNLETRKPTRGPHARAWTKCNGDGATEAAGRSTT
jgi:hypothetical protein